jgi:hypothetical protein
MPDARADDLSGLAQQTSVYVRFGATSAEKPAQESPNKYPKSAFSVQQAPKSTVLSYSALIAPRSTFIKSGIWRFMYQGDRPAEHE